MTSLELDLGVASGCAKPAASVVRLVAPDAHTLASMDATMRAQLERLLVSLLFSGRKNIHAIAFAGVGPGSGATTVCYSAACVLAAQSQERVCVVDANFSTPSLHERFGIENRDGLYAALNGRAVRLLPEQISNNLWALPAGISGARDGGMVSQDRLQQVARDLASEFRYVLVDVPAAMAGSCALTLGRALDGVVLVVRAGETRKETAVTVMQHLTACSIPVLGTVLNARRFPIPRAIYSRL